MDMRRLCVAHPSRGQANLTRSWCNEVALCRTSSLQQAFKSCRWLVCRTRNTTAEGPLRAQLGATSRCVGSNLLKKKKTRRRVHQRNLKVLFLIFLFLLSEISDLTVCQLCSRAHCSALSIRTASASLDFTQLSHHTNTHRHAHIHTQVKWPSGCLCALVKSLHWVSSPAHAAN